MHTDVYLQAVWPNRLILLLSSAADPRQVSTVKSSNLKVRLSWAGVATSTRRVSVCKAPLSEWPSKKKWAKEPLFDEALLANIGLCSILIPKLHRSNDLIDLYFKLCGTNMLHKKQIIHKIYNEMTDRRETRIIYCQLNVLCSRMLVSIHSKV